LCADGQARGKAQDERKQCAPAQRKARRVAMAIGIGRPEG
jgi:hypothetical protein